MMKPVFDQRMCELKKVHAEVEVVSSVIEKEIKMEIARLYAENPCVGTLLVRHKFKLESCIHRDKILRRLRSFVQHFDEEVDRFFKDLGLKYQVSYGVIHRELFNRNTYDVYISVFLSR